MSSGKSEEIRREIESEKNKLEREDEKLREVERDIEKLNTKKGEIVDSKTKINTEIRNLEQKLADALHEEAQAAEERAKAKH